MGDRNTKFFHTSKYKKFKHIGKLKDSASSWETSEQEISDIKVNDFKKRFHLDSYPNENSMRDFVSILDPCITQAGNDALLKQVSDEKILDAIKSIGPLKASGSDGIHASFYQNC